MMLNTLGVPVGRMEKINGNFPRIVSGHSVEVGGENYNDVRKVAEGGFAKIYVGKHQGQLESLKVGIFFHKSFFFKLHHNYPLDELITLVILCLLPVFSGSKSSSGVGVCSCGGATCSTQQQGPANVDGKQSTT